MSRGLTVQWATLGYVANADDELSTKVPIMFDVVCSCNGTDSFHFSR